MTEKVTDEKTITKKKSCFSGVEKTIIVSAFVLLGFVLLGSMLSLTSFHVSSNFTDERKAAIAKSVLMPQIAKHIERTGVRGFQDPDFQVETKAFGSMDELVAAMPSLGSYKYSTVSTGSDVKGKSAKKYEIAKVCPSSSRASVLALDFSSVSDLQMYWTWEYSILEYRDGSCRFVVLQVPN